MTVRRVMGIETEYGISCPGDPAANPMILSGQVVNAYASAQGIRAAHASWDYADEAPLRDARGFEMGRGTRRPQPAHRRGGPDPRQRRPHQRRPPLRRPRAPRVLLAGGRPRRAPPSPWTGPARSIMAESVATALPRSRPGSTSTRTTPTARAQSYGTHENYLMRRETPFTDIVRHLVPFFVARQVRHGSGRVGIGIDSRTAGYQLEPAQRLLRGRGGARDDAQAPDHQHPRRAARGGRPLPAAARHHR